MDMTVDLVTEINREHQLAEASAQSAIAHAIRCGELLLEAKAKVKHGEWGPWLADNFKGSERTARGYMRVAKNRQRVADLSVRGALQALSEPKGEGDGAPTALDEIFETRAEGDGLHMPALAIVMPWEDVIDIMDPSRDRLLREAPEDCWPFLSEVGRMMRSEPNSLFIHYVEASQRLNRSGEVVKSLMDMTTAACKQYRRVRTWRDANNPSLDDWLARKDAQIERLER